MQQYFVSETLSTGDEINLDDAKAIVAVTNVPHITVSKLLWPNKGKRAKPKGTTYVVTALDRCNNESDGCKPVTVPF